MIYITGDTHGDISRFSQPAMRQLNENDILIVCGDFGFVWDNSKQEMKRLKQLEEKKYTICFIDGAHENFDLLNAYSVSEWNGGKVHRIGANIYHLMRGQVYNIRGQKVFTMGGGESPDIELRSEDESWAKSAIPTQEELMEGAKNLEKEKYDVDIIISHEPPAKVKGLLMLHEKESAQFTVLNTYFDEIARVCKYRKWYFGSLHIDKYISSTQTSVFQNIIDSRTGKAI